MRARRIRGPTFTAQELRDLIAFWPQVRRRRRRATLRASGPRTRAGDLHCQALSGMPCRERPGAWDPTWPSKVCAGACWSLRPPCGTRRRPCWPRCRTADHRAGTRAEEMADVVAYLFSVRYFAEPGNIRNGGRWRRTRVSPLPCPGGERGKPARSQPGEGLESPAAVIAAVESRSRHAAGAGQKRPLIPEVTRWGTSSAAPVAEPPALMIVLALTILAGLLIWPASASLRRRAAAPATWRRGMTG